jgi:membrane-associated phospholipid phosphatase
MAAARWRDLALFATATGGAGIIVWLMKRAIDADRPLPEPLGPDGGASFPSAHASSWAALVTVVALIVPRPARVAVAVAGGLLVLAIGASRVYLGAHDPRDVIGGFALGVAWTAAVVLAFDRWEARSPRARRAPKPAR